MTNLPKDIRRSLSVDSSVIDPKFKQKLKKSIIQGGTMPQKQSKTTSIFSTKHFLPVAGASLLLIGLVGVGSYMYSSNNSKKEMLSEIQLPNDLSDLKPLEDIRTLAASGLLPDVSITGIELEQEEGTLMYKVKYSDGTLKYYNARTGELVVKSETELDDSVPANFVAGITIDKAREAAQAVYPSKSIVKIELETEEGVVVYSVRFNDESRVDVSASDGSIVRTKDAVNNQETTASNKDSDDSVDSEDHAEEDTEDDGDKSGSSNEDSNSEDKPEDDR